MAAGFSKRFGAGNKLLAPFRGKALARHTLDLVCSLASANPASAGVVPGGLASGVPGHVFGVFFIAAEDAVLALADALPLRPIRNRHPERGQRESIRLGLTAAGPAEYYFFFPCDQPLLDAATVCRIAAARRPGRIVQPCYRGEPGSPVLFSGLFRDELLGLGEGERGRTVIDRHRGSLIRLELTAVPVPPPHNPLTDIDDPQTLAG
ncbi:MAG: nucleotidyltransferase family protein, partial [Treponema sp.]|nr:nucleotidyltransferase family protein [Treponema sp.]